MTDSNRLERRTCSDSEERYRSLIRKVQTAIVLHDGQGRILDSNPLAEELLGLSADQLRGKALIDPEWHFLREDGSSLPVTEYPVSLVLSSRQPLRNYLAGISRPDRDAVTWVLVNAEPEYTEAEDITLVIVSFVDITARKRAEEELGRMNERFALASSAARLGIWDWDIQNNALLWDDMMYELYGIKREDFAGAYEAWLQGVYPDDRDACDEASKRARSGEQEYDTEFRVVWPDGTIHYLKAYGQIVRDANGAPLRMTGVNFDITRRKQAEEALNRLNEELEQRVRERTKELERRNRELEQMNKAFVGRELKMVELKKQIKELEENSGKSGDQHD
jgi:PAS domain S-box-containing protein